MCAKNHQNIFILAKVRWKNGMPFLLHCTSSLNTSMKSTRLWYFYHWDLTCCFLICISSFTSCLNQKAPFSFLPNWVELQSIWTIFLASVAERILIQYIWSKFGCWINILCQSLRNGDVVKCVVTMSLLVSIVAIGCCDGTLLRWWTLFEHGVFCTLHIFVSPRVTCVTYVMMCRPLWWTSGSDGSAGFTDLHNEAGEEGSSPRGAAARRQVRQRYLTVWSRLLDTATTSEDCGGGAHHHRSPRGPGEDGTSKTPGS